MYKTAPGPRGIWGQASAGRLGGVGEFGVAMTLAIWCQHTHSHGAFGSTRNVERQQLNGIGVSRMGQHWGPGHVTKQ